jgi:hypothetical protein
MQQRMREREQVVGVRERAPEPEPPRLVPVRVGARPVADPPGTEEEDPGRARDGGHGERLPRLAREQQEHRRASQDPHEELPRRGCTHALSLASPTSARDIDAERSPEELHLDLRGRRAVERS